MGKFSMFLFMVYAAVVGYLGVLNHDEMTLVLYGGTVYQIPKIILVLISSALGALLMFLGFLVRDTRRFISTIQTQKKMRKDERIRMLYSRALDEFFSQRWDDAREILEQVLKEAPEHIDALLKLGSIKYNAREFSSAFSYYRRAYSIDPARAETLFALADVKEAGGAYAEALAFVDEALELDEDNVRALYRKRDLLEKMEKWDDIVYLQKRIIKMKKSEKGKEREQLNLIGYKYEQWRQSLESGNVEKAQKAFRTILRLDRKFIPAHLGLAETILREGNADDAVDYLENVFLQVRSLIVLARIEDLLINVDEPGRLISIYRHALLSEPENVSLRLMLGKLYYRLEMLDDALDTLQAIESSGGTHPELSKILGSIYLKRNQPERAAHEFRRVIDVRSAFRVPYCCANCGFFAVEWAGRCPSCRSWNTFQFDIFDSCKTVPV